MQTQTKTDFDTDQPLFARQMELEQLYSKNQLHKRIREEFENNEDFDFTAYMEAQEIPVSFGYKLMAEMVLRKRTTPAVLIGVMRSYFDDTQATANMLEKCCEADLVHYDPAYGQFITAFLIGDDVQEELDRYQFPLPMVVPPRPIIHNKSTGYMIDKGSVILRNNHHDDDVCLDHLNRMNQIRFTLNMDTATMVKNSWRDLDQKKPGETRADFNRRCKAFDKYDRAAKDVMHKLTELGNVHYMTHRYDKRGRTYCMGYHVNYQGAPWNKAVVELADKEHVQ